MRRNTVKKSRAGSSSQSKKNTSVVNRMKTKANHPSKSQLVKTTSKAASTVLRRSQRSSQSGRQDDQMDEDEDEAEVEAVVSSEKGGGIKEGALGIDDYPPTEKEWKAMKTYTTLLIPGRNDVEHHFNLHDIVLVIPENMRFRDPKKKTPVLDFWVARIVDIRSPRNHPELLWCKVHWFYNKDHFAAHLKQSRQQIPFNPKRCGKYELIDTDHESYISVPCIEDHADVTYYYENRLNQPNVSCFYVRTMYNFKTNTLKTPAPTCLPGKWLCKRPYNPDEDIQYYCPPCDRWYHDQCIANAHWDLKPSDIRKLSNDPANLIMQSLPSLSIDDETPASPSPKSSPRRSSRNTNQDTSSAHPSPEKQSGISGLKITIRRKGSSKSITVPKSLVGIAQQQIIRGVNYGVVGNANPVCRARQFIAEIMSGEKDVSDLANWKEEIGVRYVSRWESAHSQDSPSPKYFKCGHCSGII